MAEYSPFRRDPLIPHPVTAGDDILPDCGHSAAALCDGCGSCATCEGCYCGEAEDEPAHLLAAS